MHRTCSFLQVLWVSFPASLLTRCLLTRDQNTAKKYSHNTAKKYSQSTAKKDNLNSAKIQEKYSQEIQPKYGTQQQQGCPVADIQLVFTSIYMVKYAVFLYEYYTLR